MGGSWIGLEGTYGDVNTRALNMLEAKFGCGILGLRNGWHKYKAVVQRN